MQKQGQLSIALVCVILGVMLAVQFRTTKTIQYSLPYQRVEDLSQRLQSVEKERDALLAQLRNLHQRSASDAATIEMDTLKMDAGMVPVQGPGIIITVDDTKLSAPLGNKNPNLYLIKDEDILKILNELRAGGAEAISINNQRIIASSEFRTAGSVFSVNNKSLSSPLEIKVIGDPAALENSLKLKGGVIETLQFWGIRVSVKQQDNLKILGFNGPFRFNFAQPVKNGGEN